MGKINDLKEQALATLKGKWGSFVGLTFVYFLIAGIASSVAQFGTIFTGSSFTTLAYIMTGSGYLARFHPKEICQHPVADIRSID